MMIQYTPWTAAKRSGGASRDEGQEKIMMVNITKLIENKANKIIIVSGEGENGGAETFLGKRTIRAIKMRLTKERSGGDRWAKAKVYSHTNDFGDVYGDVETGEYCS